MEFLKGAVVHEHIFHVHGIIFSLHEKGRRRQGGRVDAGVEHFESRRRRQIGGIDGDGKVRFRAHAGQRIGWCSRSCVSGMIRGEDRQVCSRGEAQNANLLRLNVPFSGAAAGDPDGLLGIFKVCHVLRKSACLGYAVFYEQAGDTEGAEPGADCLH